VEVFSTYVSINALPGQSSPAHVPQLSSLLPKTRQRPAAQPSGEEGTEGSSEGSADGSAAEGSEPLPDAEYSNGEWTDAFANALQSQHARVREFLESRSNQWRQVVARCERQIEQLQSEIAELTTANEDLRDHAATVVRHEPGEDRSDEPSKDYLAAMDEITELKTRNSDLQKQLREANSAPRRSGQAAPAADIGSDWESQKRRLLAELESDEANGRTDSASTKRRIEIDEIIARTDRVIAEKDREIEELKHLLESQTGSLGGLAMGAAALEEVFSQDDIIREERQRLQQAQNELREKLRQSEIDHATERARLARREAEIEERLRAEPQHASSNKDSEALAPTGRPVRGRWRTQLGLGEDGAAEGERRR
jgi:hypothetical protein